MLLSQPREPQVKFSPTSNGPYVVFVHPIFILKELFSAFSSVKTVGIGIPVYSDKESQSSHALELCMLDITVYSCEGGLTCSHSGYVSNFTES